VGGDCNHFVCTVQQLAAQADAGTVQPGCDDYLTGHRRGGGRLRGVGPDDADARRCLDIGASCVWVSNHGGRQLDGAPATVDVLEPIVDAVRGEAEIVFDGGIRRGSDIVKALALGATACAIGRAYLWGLSAGGEAGVSRALTILESELMRTLALIGAPNIAAIRRDMAAAPV
jgi:L-lactate dehydrogenase (cytochrome)